MAQEQLNAEGNGDHPTQKESDQGNLSSQLNKEETIPPPEGHVSAEPTVVPSSLDVCHASTLYHTGYTNLFGRSTAMKIIGRIVIQDLMAEVNCKSSTKISGLCYKLALC